MTKTKKNVVMGLLGSVLDRAKGNDRWNSWRPSVSICQQEDLLVDRFELIHTQENQTLASRVIADIRSVSPETEITGHPLAIRDPWDFEEVYTVLHQFAREYRFDQDQNEYLIHITTGTHVEQICLFLLAESHHLPGALLQTSPPRGNLKRAKYPEKQLGIGGYKVIDLDLSKYDQIASRFEQDQTESLHFLKAGIATRNAAFNQMIEQIERVALASDAPLLLLGPTGSGKSSLAKRIYELKRQRGLLRGDFVEVNCATLRGEQAMSTLFGHKKGAFTGAVSDRLGLLKSADGGILFLDEVGELGQDEQAMLLRAIEDKRFQPVGSDGETTSDFSLIAGTNRNLFDAVKSGNFREDLLARINLWTFELPGLAQRREDIEPNIEFELKSFAARSGKSVAFNREAKTKFLQFATSAAATWQANFRDLNAAMTRMAILSHTGRIDSATVSEEIDRLKLSWSNTPDELDELSHLMGKAAAKLDLFDAMQLQQVIKICRRSRSLSEAGRTLYAESRKGKKQPNDADRLRKYLAKFQLSWSDIQD